MEPENKNNMVWLANGNRTVAPPRVSNITIIVGEPGVGKTHLLSRMPAADDGTPRGLYVPIGNEQGLGGFADGFTAERIMRAPRTLYELEDFLLQLIDGNARGADGKPLLWDRIGMETTSAIWNLIEDAVCREEGITHFSQKDTYARAWTAAMTKLRRLFEKIQTVRNRTGAAFIITAHQREYMSTSAIGGHRIRVADIELPSMEKTRDHVARMRELADNVWFLAQVVVVGRGRGTVSYTGSKRVLITRRPIPSDRVEVGFFPEAKSRGNRPPIIDADWRVLVLGAGDFEQYRATAETLLQELSPGEVKVRLATEYEAALSTKDLSRMDLVIEEARQASYVFNVSDSVDGSGVGTVESGGGNS